MKYQRFLEPQQENFLLDLGKAYDVEVSFTWSKDKKAFKAAFQKCMEGISENSSKLEILEITQKLDEFVQLSQKIEKRMEDVKNELNEFRQEWNNLLNLLQVEIPSLFRLKWYHNSASTWRYQLMLKSS